jgi:hypothetical protein
MIDINLSLVGQATEQLYDQFPTGALFQFRHTVPADVGSLWVGGEVGVNELCE